MNLFRSFKYPVASWLLIFYSNVAKADNCGSLGDCFTSAEAAAMAAAALTLIAGLVIDFSPLGRARGILEAVTGIDAITGQRLGMIPRLLGLIPGGRTARKLDASVDAVRNASRGLDDLYKRAPAAKAEIDAIADKIAKNTGGTVAKAPLKGRDRALEKVVNDYGGDATRLKDVARNTIVVPPHKYDDAVRELERHGAKVKKIEAKDNPLGYSGTNTTVNTKNGMPGEIQVNTPEMIFAKETPQNAKAILGDDVYNDISRRTGVEGGKGHKYYEEWRQLPDGNPRKLELERQSRDYYDSIRGMGE